MARIISERVVGGSDNVKRYELVFSIKDGRGAEVVFPCTRKGEVILSEVPEGQVTIEMCRANPRMKYQGIRESFRSPITPAVLECDCGTHVTLSQAFNHCPSCNTRYYVTGSKL